MNTVLPLRAAAALFCVFACTRLSAGSLEDYVRKPDDSFSWQVRDTQKIDGLEIKCREDFAAKVIDWRGLYKNAGA